MSLPGAFLLVEQRFAQGFAAVHRVHLIAFAIALQRAAAGLAERGVERRGEFGRIGHDRGLGETGLIQRPANRPHLAIHRRRRREAELPRSVPRLVSALILLS